MGSGRPGHSPQEVRGKRRRRVLRGQSRRGPRESRVGADTRPVQALGGRELRGVADRRHGGAHLARRRRGQLQRRRLAGHPHRQPAVPQRAGRVHRRRAGDDQEGRGGDQEGGRVVPLRQRRHAHHPQSLLLASPANGRDLLAAGRHRRNHRRIQLGLRGQPPAQMPHRIDHPVRVSPGRVSRWDKGEPGAQQPAGLPQLQLPAAPRRDRKLGIQHRGADLRLQV